VQVARGEIARNWEDIEMADAAIQVCAVHNVRGARTKDHRHWHTRALTHSHTLSHTQEEQEAAAAMKAEAAGDQGGGAASAPAVVEESAWLQCCTCTKWRVVPKDMCEEFGSNEDAQWFCAMLTISCDTERAIDAFTEE
jgi:hypothetical protein